MTDTAFVHTFGDGVSRPVLWSDVLQDITPEKLAEDLARIKRANEYYYASDPIDAAMRRRILAGVTFDRDSALRNAARRIFG